MQAFTELFTKIDRTTRTSEKTAALTEYFKAAEPEDATWALSVLLGRKLIRAVSYKRLRVWAGEVSGHPDWLLAECHSTVGDMSETLALILPPAAELRGDDASEPEPDDVPLREVVRLYVLPLEQMTEAEQRGTILEAWARFDGDQRFLFHKLISGNFRIGAAQKVVVNALAGAAEVDPAVMQHRLSGRFDPTPEAFAALLDHADDGDPARPYPFYLSYQLDEDPAEVLGDVSDWLAEWKWDGIRSQIIRRGDATLVWSRGDELMTERFPELADVARACPDGTVLDGEILAWDPAADQVRPFGELQTRINRKHQPAMLFVDVPVVFMAYDVMEHGGEDVRQRPTVERRRLLEDLAGPLAAEPGFRLSPMIEATAWSDLSGQRERSRELGVEGLMLKRRDSVYGVGRQKNFWWKWKVDPYTVDCVMVYAQRGTGRRSTLYTDYTFAVWDAEPEQGGSGWAAVISGLPKSPSSAASSFSRTAAASWVDSGLRLPCHRGTCAFLPADFLTLATIPRTRTSSSSIPPKTKRSPGLRKPTKYSSTTPSDRPLPSLSWIIALLVMVPMFRRWSRAILALVTVYRPSSPSSTRLNCG